VRELYVYYRVPEDDAAAAEAEAQQFQSALRARTPGLMTRLLRRPEASAGRSTWMEVYTMDPQVDAAGVGAALQADIEREAARRLTRIEGDRHVEVFVACAS
jgi:Domain of unknown function (DUF4936)